MNTTFKISLEAAKGTTKVEQCEEGLRSSLYGDYEHPPIPNGYHHVEGEWNNGFVIQDKRGNQFVWIPVGSLSANGTLDCEFCEKFGRRNYRKDEFSICGFHEVMDDDLKQQFQSIKKHGGFYISRYTVSKGNDGLFYVIKGMMPLVNTNFDNSLTIAQKLGQGNITSHLVYGAEYDSMIEWFLETGKTQKDIVIDSTALGNYWNCENSPQEVVKTGSYEKWQVNAICDIAGNVWEWTQEVSSNSSYRTIRGGSFGYYGHSSPVACRGYHTADNDNCGVGFRVSLHILA